MRLILIVLLFISLSCQKEEEYDVRKASAEYCHDNMEFTCELSPEDEIFFTAKLNGEDFCISAPHQDYDFYSHDYYASNGVAVTSVTSTNNPSLPNDAPTVSSFYSVNMGPPIFDNLNGLVRDFQPSVTIETPRILDSTIFSAQSYIEDYLKMGELPLLTNNEEKTEGFNFNITWSCVNRPGYTYYKQKNPARIPAVGMWLSPNYGPSSDARLEIVDFVKRETDELIQYFVTFEINCELYYEHRFYRGDYFGKLEDGVFKTIIEIVK